jgi:hypothetical protein
MFGFEETLRPPEDITPFNASMLFSDSFSEITIVLVSVVNDSKPDKLLNGLKSVAKSGASNEFKCEIFTSLATYIK